MFTYQAARIRTRGGKRAENVYTYVVRKTDPNSGDLPRIFSIREIARLARRPISDLRGHIEIEFSSLPDSHDVIDITDYIRELSSALRKKQRHARMAAVGNPVSKTKAERLVKLRGSLLARKLAVFDKPEPDE